MISDMKTFGKSKLGSRINASLNNTSANSKTTKQKSSTRSKMI